MSDARCAINTTDVIVHSDKPAIRAARALVTPCYHLGQPQNQEREQ